MERVVTALTNLSSARTRFIETREHYNPVVVTQFFMNEYMYLNVLASVTPTQTVINLTITMDRDVLSNVMVTPTPQQVQHEVMDWTGDSNCSICQDLISSGGAQLRVSHHTFHRNCIETWFGASVRCPICRRDIREDHQAQTSSASTEISSQEENLWGGEQM